VNVLDGLHGRHIHPRRVRVLTHQLARLIPVGAHVLDVGCGDGLLSASLASLRADLTVEGADVLVRSHTQIPVRQFDGNHLPFDDATFDVVLFVDVLHHVDDPLSALAEARRVAPLIVLKDHLRQGVGAHACLRFMDWIGNARHGVALPYQYWTPQQWEDAFRELQLHRVEWHERLGLYPTPASWIFERSLHFVAKLSRGAT
jgi:SAM-dependent methyltransferase